MGIKSSIETLPRDVLDKLHAWLRDPHISQLAATERLNALCIELNINKRSKSAVNRYAQKMELVGRKIRERREIAQMWTAKIGEAPDGEAGQLLIEVIRNFAFDMVLAIEENGGQVDPKELKNIAWAVEKLENASQINDKRQRDIEQRALAIAAKSVEVEAKSQGLTDEAIIKIKNKILKGN